MTGKVRARGASAVQVVVAALLLSGATCGGRPSTSLDVGHAHYVDVALATKKTRLTLAVLPFKLNARTAPADLPVADLVLTSLSKVGRFELVERARLDEVVQEIMLDRKLVDATTAAEVGKLVGASTVLFGSVASATQQTTDKFAYDLTATEVRIDARAIDTTTGRVLLTASSVGRSEVKSFRTAGGVDIVALKPESLLEEYAKATVNAADNVGEKLAAQYPSMGIVIAREGSTLLTDLGSDKGLAQGDRILVVRALEQLATEPPSFRKQTLGVAKVKEVDGTTSQLAVSAPKETPAAEAGDLVIVQRAR